jgi:general secretion pathway protein E
MVAELLAVPVSLIESLAIDVANSKVYVDRRFAGNPMLLTWVDRNASLGIQLKIIPSDLDVVAKWRSNGMRLTETVGNDQAVRAQAINIIVKAASYGASDIHFMLRGDYTEIQIVVKGGLRTLHRFSQAEGEALTRAIYQGVAKTRDASYNSLEFQNAQIPGDELPPEAHLTSVRIVRGPCYPQAQDGGFMTMRLQYSPAKSSEKQGLLEPLPMPKHPPGTFGLSLMGYTELQVEKLKTLMDAPNGVVIFTGPTGSGKTTAMFECLKEGARSKPQRRLVTIEDPVEYPMEWAVQMAITGARNDAETGTAFGERIRVALRMAPNIILLGELRGPDVAVAALEAAVTGHQVWTTMHVTDPFLFVERLELMDRVRLERRVFCDHKIVRGIVGQRLLPKLCPHCSISMIDNPGVLPNRISTALETWEENISEVRLQGPGCDQCGFDGTLGRFAVAEVVILDAVVMRDFVEYGSEKARDNYRLRPGADPSMLEVAIRHALAGQVDPRSVEDWVDLIEPRDWRSKRD